MAEETCPSCGAHMTEKVKKMTYTYKGAAIEVDQPGKYCDVCPVSVLDREDMAATRQELKEFRSGIVEGFKEKI